MVHMIEWYGQGTGRDPIRTYAGRVRGSPESAGAAGGGEHDAGSFQLGLNP
jgi:hypothetical protein